MSDHKSTGSPHLVLLALVKNVSRMYFTCSLQNISVVLTCLSIAQAAAFAVAGMASPAPHSTSSAFSHPEAHVGFCSHSRLLYESQWVPVEHHQGPGFMWHVG